MVEQLTHLTHSTGTHISNTREAKAFALLSEEGIAKGVRRITAVTTDCAFKAMELARSLDQEISGAAKIEVSQLEKKVASLKSRVQSATIPAAMKTDLSAKISQLQDQVRKEMKKIAQENVQKAKTTAAEMADAAASNGESFCVCHVNVGLDAAAVREAVIRTMDQKGMSVMIFSTDETTNKAVACAGVVENVDKSKDLDVLEWFTAAMEPLKGRGGKGNVGKRFYAQGQGTDASHLQEAMDIATAFASMRLR